MEKIDYTQGMAQFAQKLSSGGVFLTAGIERPNTMTIGWGSIGVIWGKPMLTVLVRPSRHTFSLIRESGAFTVSIPTENPLKAELAFAGTASGREVDKFEGHGLTAVPGELVNAPTIAECGLHYECTVCYDQAMEPERLNAPYLDRFYPEGDFHTVFIGEIVACYRRSAV